MTKNQRQGRAKLTARTVRQGGRLRGVAGGGIDETPLTAKRETRRYKPRARKCACGCGRQVTPTVQAPHKKFYEDACRKRAARLRAKKHKKTEAVERDLELVTCAYCGHGFFSEQGRGGKYCTPSHKQLAYVARREAAALAIAHATRMTIEAAAALVKSAGMNNCSLWLQKQGFLYDEQARRWAKSFPEEFEIVA